VTPAEDAVAVRGASRSDGPFAPSQVVAGAARQGDVGMQGGVRIRAELVAGRTRITDLACRPPLQVLRAHHVDAVHPDLASVMLASPAGGILQGDQLAIDIAVGSGARLRVGTQSASRVYRSPAAEATQAVRLEVARDGYLEYLPEPWIPYAGSRLRSQTKVVLDAGGAAILVETIGPGRAARREVLAFDRFESSVEIERPGGKLLATDTVLLEGSRRALGRVGLLGDSLALATVLVLQTGIGPDALRAAAAASSAAQDLSHVSFGASSLPNDAGAWLRILARGLDELTAVVAAAVAAARLEVHPPFAA
jgi:urease accessory protein